MGYALLWLEDLVLWLLVVAWAVAIAGGLRNRWARGVLILLAIAFPVLVWGVATAAIAQMESAQRIQTGLLYPAIAMLGCLAVGGVLIAIRGGLAGGGKGGAARPWRAGPLAVAVVVTVLAHLMTFWNLDLSVRQQMDSLRIEAGALALSVAPPQVPDRENAASLYLRAFDTGLLDKNPEGYGDWLDATSGPDVTMDCDNPEFVAYVQSRRALMQLLREAAARPACSFTRDWGRPSLAMLLPEVQNMRAAARDMQLEAHYKAAHGDLHGALQNVLAMHQMAEHVGQEPLLVSLLVSMAFDSMAAQNLEHFLKAYPVTEQDLAALDAWQPTAMGPRLRRAFRMEEAFGLSTFCRMADSRDVKELQDLGMDATGPIPWGPSVSPVYRVFFLAEDVRMYRQFMNLWQRIGTLPFEQREQEIAQLTKSLTTSPMGVMTRMLLPAMESVLAAASRAETKQRLAEAAVAAHRYRLAKGKFPETLDQLVDFQRTLVVRDPFGSGQLQLVSRDGQRVLYGIGPNLTDDGGTPFDDKQLTGDLTFLLFDAKQPVPR